MSELFGKIYRVTPETSELLQLAVFEAGGCWESGLTLIQAVELEYLFVSNNGRISWDTEEGFNATIAPEGFLKVVKTVKLVQPPLKTERELQLEAVLAKIDEFKSKIDELKVEAEKLKGRV